MSYPSPHDPFGQQPASQFSDQGQFPSPGGYYVPPQYDARYGIRPPQTSGLAICSLIGGIISFAACWFGCCCILSPVTFATSVTSVLFGHLALNHIHKSMGSVSGREMAWIGLGLGYPAAVVSACFLSFFAYTMIEGARQGAAGGTANVIQAPGEAELRKVEDKIASDDLGTALGNSEQAKAMAKAFSERMKAQRDTLAEENPQYELKTREGEFVTWCELRDGQVAFVVNIPGYRNFSDEGKAEIEERAWSTAQEVLRDQNFPEGTKLAVGAKGLILWGSVMTGQTVAKDGADDGIEEESDEEDLLYPFFATEKDESMPVEEGGN